MDKRPIFIQELKKCPTVLQQLRLCIEEVKRINATIKPLEDMIEEYQIPELYEMLTWFSTNKGQLESLIENVTYRHEIQFTCEDDDTGNTIIGVFAFETKDSQPYITLDDALDEYLKSSNKISFYFQNTTTNVMCYIPDSYSVSSDILTITGMCNNDENQIIIKDTNITTTTIEMEDIMA